MTQFTTAQSANNMIIKNNELYARSFPTPLDKINHYNEVCNLTDAEVWEMAKLLRSNPCAQQAETIRAMREEGQKRMQRRAVGWVV